MSQQDRFTEAESRRAGPAWLRESRRSAFARFSELGFPTDADEDWRFTRIDPISKTEFSLPPASGGGELGSQASALAD